MSPRCATGATPASCAGRPPDAHLCALRKSARERAAHLCAIQIFLTPGDQAGLHDAGSERAVAQHDFAAGAGRRLRGAVFLDSDEEAQGAGLSVSGGIDRERIEPAVQTGQR